MKENIDIPLLKDRIKYARKRCKFSQEDLANLCGVSRAAVSQWENGETKDLKSSNLVVAAYALGVTDRWLGNNVPPMISDGEITMKGKTLMNLPAKPPEKTLSERAFRILIESFDDIYQVSSKTNSARYRAIYAYLLAGSNEPASINKRDEDHKQLKAILETIL